MGNTNCSCKVGFKSDDTVTEAITVETAGTACDGGRKSKSTILDWAPKADEANAADVTDDLDDLPGLRDGLPSMREDLRSMNDDLPIGSDGFHRQVTPSFNDPFVEAGSVPVPTVPELTREIVQATLDRHFPGALPGPFFQLKLLNTLKGYGFTPQNTIFGTSVCSDEINTTKGTLIDGLSKYWGTNFPLGGIGGAPYVGKTGFFAFSHHVPDDGNVLVLFGPHVGITASGEVGKCLRDGQKAESTACGACVAAYKQSLERRQQTPDMELDMQQSWLRGQLSLQVERIQAAEEPMAEVAKVSYEAVRRMVAAIANTNFGPGYLALVGGIQINMPRGYPDYFLPLHFTLERKEVVGMHRSASLYTALKQDGGGQGEPVETPVVCVDCLGKLTQAGEGRPAKGRAANHSPTGATGAQLDAPSTQASKEDCRPAKSDVVMGA